MVLREDHDAPVVHPVVDRTVRGDGSSAETIGRVSDVAITQSGHFVIADALAKDVKVYDRDGVFVRTLGAVGSGPGESQAVEQVLVDKAGHLFAPDMVLGRVNVFEVLSGRLLTTVGFDLTDAVPVQWSSPWNGDLVVGVIPGGVGTLFAAAGLASPSIVLRAFVDGRFEDITETSVSVNITGRGVPLLAGRPVVAASPDGNILIGDPDAEALTLYDRSGSLVGTVTLSRLPLVPISRADADAIRRAAARNEKRLLALREMTRGRVSEVRTGELLARLRTKADARPVAEHHPRFTGVLIDGQQRLWLRQSITADYIASAPFSIDWDDLNGGSSEWKVFDAGGALTATVRLPFGFVLTQVGKGGLLYGYQITADGDRVVTRLRLES